MCVTSTLESMTSQSLDSSQQVVSFNNTISSVLALCQGRTSSGDQRLYTESDSAAATYMYTVIHSREGCLPRCIICVTSRILLVTLFYWSMTAFVPHSQYLLGWCLPVTIILVLILCSHSFMYGSALSSITSSQE